MRYPPPPPRPSQARLQITPDDLRAGKAVIVIPGMPYSAFAALPGAQWAEWEGDPLSLTCNRHARLHLALHLAKPVLIALLGEKLGWQVGDQKEQRARLK